MQLHELPGAVKGAPPLADLLDYLVQRQRSGLVKLARPPRLLYLIPPVAGVAEAMGVDERVAPPPGLAWLWAVVVFDPPRGPQ